MVDFSRSHRFLPRQPDEGKELEQILERRKAITEGKKVPEGLPGNFMEGSKTVKANPSGLPGGIRDRRAEGTVKDQIETVSSKTKSEQKDEPLSERVKIVPLATKALTPAEKREMLNTVSKMPPFFDKVSYSNRLQDSSPAAGPSNVSRLDAEDPMQKPEKTMESALGSVKGYERTERKGLKSSEKKRLMRNLNLGKPEVLKSVLKHQNASRRQGFQMYVISVNNKLFNSGCGSYKNSGELKEDIGVQRNNMRIIVYMAIEKDAVGVEDAEDLRGLLHAFDDLGYVMETVGDKKKFAQLTPEEKEGFRVWLIDIAVRAETIKQTLPKEPVELLIASESTKASALLLYNTLYRNG